MSDPLPAPGTPEYKAAIRAREEQAFDLSQQGKSTRTIARELGISHVAVWKHLCRVNTRCLKELGGKVEASKFLQSAQLDHLLEETIAAWERSKALPPGIGDQRLLA